MSRPSTGKRQRFEIFKRDGFACRYCGADAATSVLHVDHVVSVADGGTSDDDNLVTSCADCNLGKSSVPLTESQLKPRPSTESMLEHAEQIKAYLDAVRTRDSALAELAQYVIDAWEAEIGYLNHDTEVAIKNGVRDVGIDRAVQAVHSVARSSVSGVVDRTRYFCGVIRNMRKGV